MSSRPSEARAGTHSRPEDGAMAYYVYLLASQKRGALYTGVTDNLARRIQEHKTGATGRFTQLYGVKNLVYV